LLTAGITLMVGASDGSWVPNLGIITVLVVTLGVVFFAVSYVSRRELISSRLNEASIVLGWYVALEFLAGVGLAFIGVGNLLLDVGRPDWSLVAIAVFGLLLVTDSWLTRSRDAKQDVRKKEVS
ncbi:MAG: hypothetical protein QXQ13_07680, partial [Thermoplasmata archaeon]